jgi:hypothetical protein
MLRSFFLAAGMFVCILGAECLAVEKVVLKLRDPPPASANPFANGEQALGPQKVIVPADWVPFSLLAAGAITIIYSFTLPRWVKGDK